MSDSLTVSVGTRIDAPLPTVWRVLTDFGNYHNWHPVLSLEPLFGRPVVGAKLTGLSSGAPVDNQRVEFTVGAVQEPNALAWTGGDPELIVGRHSFQLEQLADRTTTFIESEVFTGPEAQAALGDQLPQLHDMYERFSAALKNRVHNLPQ